MVNQRLMNAAGRAANKTPKADKLRIEAELGAVGRKFRIASTGRIIRGRKIYATGRQGAPLAALIINKRRGPGRGLHGKAMEAAIRRMVGGRRRSVGFNTVGYFPGIKRLASTLKRPFIIARMSGISVVGQPKGRAEPAPPNTIYPSALIENSATAIVKIGGPALQEGMDEEAQEITRHIEEQMRPGFTEFNLSR